MVHSAFVDLAIRAGCGTDVVEQPAPTTGDGDEELGLAHGLHHQSDLFDHYRPTDLPLGGLVEAVAVLSRYVDAVYTHMWMTGCYYAIPDTHGGGDRMQATRRIARVARLDTEHQPSVGRDFELGDRLVPLAASDESPVGRVW